MNLLKHFYKKNEKIKYLWVEFNLFYHVCHMYWRFEVNDYLNLANYNSCSFDNLCILEDNYNYKLERAYHICLGYHCNCNCIFEDSFRFHALWAGESGLHDLDDILNLNLNLICRTLYQICHN